MAETIGKKLKQAREAKNLTIQQVVHSTRIRAYQIEAIEADDFESLPSPVQARAFLRLYAEFLEISFEEIITRQSPNVDEFPAAPSDLPVALVVQTVPAAETSTEPALMASLSVGGKLKGLLSRIKRVVPRPRVQSVQVEPTEASNPSLHIEAESEAPAALLEEFPHPVLETPPSHLIFIAIGNTLCQRRESLSLNLDEIERHTHVGKHYLLALETGEFERLPSSVQARGMLNNYAHFLNLDVDALLLTFAEGLQAQRLERQLMPDEKTQNPTSKKPFKASFPSKIKIPAAIQRYLSVDVFVGGGLVLLLITFAIWGTSHIINLRADIKPQPTAPSILYILGSTPEATAVNPTSTTTANGSSTGVPAGVESLVLTLPAAGHGPVQIVVVALEQAWVRVTVDGRVQFEGRVTTGTAYPFDGNTQIEVLTGNGRAINILYNQNNLGPMGNLGEVVDRIYTTNAILVPTATFTSTPTITPTPTATLRPTASLRPTTTPRPSVTPRFSPTPRQ